MADFQHIYNTGRSSRFIYFDIGTSYSQGAKIIYNVTGIDDNGNTYTAVMQRGRRGEFLIFNLKQTNGAQN